MTGHSQRKPLTMIALLALCLAFCSASEATGSDSVVLAARYLQSSEDGRRVETVLLGDDGAAFPVSATVSAPDADEIVRFELVPALSEYEAVMRVLWKERADGATRMEDERGAYWTLANADGRGNDESIRLNEAEEGMRLDYACVRETGKADVSTLSGEEVRSVLQPVLSDLGIPGYMITRADGDSPGEVIEGWGTASGDLTVRFLPQYSALPVFCVLDELTGKAEFLQGGGFVLRGGLFWAERGRAAIENPLMLDQAMEAARPHIGREIIPGKGASVDAISLATYYRRGEGRGIQARPVWLFDASSSTSRGTHRRYCTYYFCVDAETGRVYVPGRDGEAF